MLESAVSSEDWPVTLLQGTWRGVNQDKTSRVGFKWLVFLMQCFRGVMEAVGKPCSSTPVPVRR